MSDTLDAFEVSVAKAFSFLETEFGFSRCAVAVEGYVWSVRYETPALYVCVLFSPPNYKPEMCFGRRGVDEGPEGFSFEIGDVLKLPHALDWEAPDHRPDHLAYLAALLRQYGALCLQGDAQTYSVMKARRETDAQEWHRAERNRVRAIAIEAAWKAKNHPALITLYSEYEGPLSPLQQGQLDFARRRV